MAAAERARQVWEEETLWDELEGTDEPKWGTPAARLREMMRLQRRIDEQRKRKKEG